MMTDPTAPAVSRPSGAPQAWNASRDPAQDAAAGASIQKRAALSPAAQEPDAGSRLGAPAAPSLGRETNHADAGGQRTGHATGAPLLLVDNLGKSFTLHLQGGLSLPVVSAVSLAVHGGECVALGGPSGAGKSSILKMVFGNYRVDKGSVQVADHDAMVEVAGAAPRLMLRLRRERIGYVSQFLRVIPRVSALDVVAAPLRAEGVDAETAKARAGALLARLNLPERLWGLPPATFSGGEQQRVNVARGFIGSQPLLLLDEPTASLDAANRAVVIDLICEKKAQGCGLLGIFHDAETRDAVADRVVDVTRFSA